MTVCTSSYTPYTPPPSCHYNFIPQQSTARQNQLVYFRSHGINCTRNKLKLLILFACYVISSCKVRRPSVHSRRKRRRRRYRRTTNSIAHLFCIRVHLSYVCELVSAIVAETVSSSSVSVNRVQSIAESE